MARYLIQLRRGVKDDASGRNDWANRADIIPLEGELVLEYDNGIPRLKIGNGKDPFSALPYMSVDSFILPKPISVTLYADKWEQMLDANDEPVADTYYQVVTVDNAVITANSKVDLNPNPSQLLDFYDAGVTLTTENDSGVVRVYVVGDVLMKSYQIQAVVTEVVVDA